MERIDDVLKKGTFTPPKVDLIKEAHHGVGDNSARRKSKPSRLYIDNEYFQRGYAAKFTPSSTAVYCVLAKYAYSKTQKCFPSTLLIQRETGLSKSTVLRAKEPLEKYKLIAVHRRKGIVNVYKLLDVSKWLPLSGGGIKDDTTNVQVVSKEKWGWYQNESISSVKSDTLNHIKKSNNINQDISYKKEGISNLTLKMLISKYGDDYSREVVVRAALMVIREGKEIQDVYFKEGFASYLESATSKDCNI